MVQENEIIVLILIVGVMVFVLVNHQRLKRLPAWRLLVVAFCLLLARSILTVLEGFLWEPVLNSLEHACYTASVVLVAVWCWKALGREEGIGGQSRKRS